MGGFEGGDEGGFWDEDALALLIKKQKNTRPAIKKEKIYIEHNGSTYSTKADTRIEFVPSATHTFTLELQDNTSPSSDSIYKAYKALREFINDDVGLEEFFSEHKVVLSCASTSLDTAAFLLLTKELCNLIISSEELVKVAKSVDDDVAHFIENYPKITA